MVSFSVLVGNEFPNRIPQGLFTKEDHLLQTVLLDRADEAFRVCVAESRRLQIVWGTRQGGSE